MLCIARAYGGHPLERLVVECDGVRAYLLKPSTDFSNAWEAAGGVGFPICDVFSHDQATLDALRQASDSGDSGLLEKAWKAAKPLAI
jgi:hypothetical protein